MRKLSHAALLILVPIFAFAQQIAPAEKSRRQEIREHALRLPRTPTASNPNLEIYRIFIIPTFYHPIAIHIEKGGHTYALIAKRLNGKGGYGWGTLKDERRRRLNRYPATELNGGWRWLIT